MTLEIKWMIRKDLPEVVAIEERCFPNPWTADEFLDNLKQRTTIGMSCLYGERVVGFMVYKLAKTQLSLLNFAVHPAFQRIGIGRAMINKLKSKLTTPKNPTRRTRISAAVSEANTAAQLFFRGQGFACVSISRNHYRDYADLSAYQFMFDITGAPLGSSEEFDWHRIADSEATVFER